MTRIALLSPLPPERSGIADFSRTLLPELAARVEVDVFTGPRADPVPGVTMRRSTDRALRRLERYDAVIAQIGNSPAHEWILRYLRYAHAVVDLHELVLHHLVAHMTIGRGDNDGYLDAMTREGGATGRLLAHAVVDGLIPPIWTLAPELYPLSSIALDSAQAVIVHSRFTAQRVRQIRPDLPVRTVPLATPIPSDRTAETLPGNPFPVVGVFGFITPLKRLPVVMRAFRRLLSTTPRARLLVVGEAPVELDPKALAAQEGIPDDALELVDFADAGRFESLMRAVHIGVNLRHPTLGESSAIVTRWMALGVPVVVSEGGWYDELPDAAVVRIATDHDEVQHLTDALEQLAGNEDRRASMAEAARRYAREHLSPAAVADEYVRFALAPIGRPAIANELLDRVASSLVDVTPGPARRATGVSERVAEAMAAIGVR